VMWNVVSIGATPWKNNNAVIAAISALRNICYSAYAKLFRSRSGNRL